MSGPLSREILHAKETVTCEHSGATFQGKECRKDCWCMKYKRGSEENPLIYGKKGIAYELENICNHIDECVERISKLEEKESDSRLADIERLKGNMTNIFERVGKLEQSVKEHQEWTRKDEDSIHGRIKTLEDHKNRQIDENRKISARVDSFEDAVNTDNEYADGQIQERLSRLESQGTGEKKIVNTILKRVTETENQIANWEEEFYFLKDKLRSPESRPYKCPVCDGDGTYREDGKIYNGRSCNACEGKGIVWN